MIRILLIMAIIGLVLGCKKEEKKVEKDIDLKKKEIITIYYDDTPPYFYEENGALDGETFKTAKNMFKLSSIEIRLQKLSQKKQILMLKNNREKLCLLGQFKKVKFSKIGKYTKPISRDTKIVGLSQKDNTQVKSGRPITILLNNRGQKLLRKKGVSYGNFIDQKLKILSPSTVYTNKNFDEMVKNVYKRKADYILITEQEAEYFIKKFSLDDKRFKVLKFLDVVSGNNRHLLCSKKVSDETIKKLNKYINYPSE